MNADEIFGLSWDAIGAIAGVASLLGGLRMAFPWIRAKFDQRSLRLRLGAEDYVPSVLTNAVRHYVQPFCSAADPAGRENFRSIHPVSQPLFRVLDRALLRANHPQYLLLLADSGMGKTSALINYYARTLRRLRRKVPIVLVYLGRRGVLERIRSVSNKPGTILLLDALDEDTAAIADHGSRIADLMQAAQEFRAVVLSCRSQFFSNDEEIVRETGIARIGPRRLGEPGEYEFEKLYLIPFSEEQIEEFIRMRYPFWKRGERSRAREVIKRMPDLNARPMLLAYIDDLVRKDEYPERLCDAYERIVEAWLKREDDRVRNIPALRRFSEQAAVEIYLGASRRGGEHLGPDEITTLAAAWGIELEAWELKGRSLLNRDAAGNYKFAHRSIMEYLFVRTSLERDRRGLGVEWTDQMLVFASELLPRTRWLALLMDGVSGAFDIGSGEERARTSSLLIHLVCNHIRNHPQPLRAHGAAEGEVAPAHYLITLLTLLMRAGSRDPFVSKLIGLDTRKAKPDSAISLMFGEDGLTDFQVASIQAREEALLRPVLTCTDPHRPFEVAIEQKVSSGVRDGVLREISVPLLVNGVGSVFYQFLHGGSAGTASERLDEVLQGLRGNGSASDSPHRYRHNSWAEAVQTVSPRYTLEPVAAHNLPMVTAAL